MKHPTLTRALVVPDPFTVRINGCDFTVRFVAGRMSVNGEAADALSDWTDLTITIVADPDPQITTLRVADAVTTTWQRAVEDGAV